MLVTVSARLKAVDGERPAIQICKVIWEGSVVVEVGSKAARANTGNDALSVHQQLLGLL